MALDDIPPMTVRCATTTHVITDADCPHCRIRELEAENERLMSLCQRWSEACTGCNGSQQQCVTLETKGE
jgi:hypothetical protein